MISISPEDRNLLINYPDKSVTRADERFREQQVSF